uniref:Retrovirus-related Pol polyprotein from transposon TNT 1-94 n=1 Tax=Cajanus cajan TaxID=3821 RepID=A0A151TCZ4_CAJCA|nr:Retrovirus-related Pol polyprotein from transposon TNT 1-94 [Cajanus cajan]
MTATAAAVKSDGNVFDLWHKRLGHPSPKVVELIPNIGSSRSDALCNKACDVCLRAKQCRESFPISINKTMVIFQLIHCDLWGPYRTISHCGARYFLTIVDDYSRAVWIYLLEEKKEVFTRMCQFFAMVERQFGKQVKVVRSDNGTEFVCMDSYFQNHGIVHETSCTGTPQQNGRVERKNRHILNVARALRFQAHLPIKFWGECVLTAGYLINRTPSIVLHGKTPYEMLYNKPPSLNHLRVFGSLCYVHNRDSKRDKFASRSRRCVFLGYPYGKKGWRVYDLELGVFLTSRDVVFSESEFPCAESQNSAPKHIDIEKDNLAPWNSVDDDDEMEIAQADFESRKDPERYRRLVGRLIYLSVTRPELSYCVHTLAQFMQHPRQEHWDAALRVVRYLKAMKDKQWQQAMQAEIQALENNGTWTLEPLPPGKKAIGCKWVYRIKYNSDGSIERFKARLVILGNNQVEGLDYNETFAPVAKMVTVRTLLAVAAARKWELHQMDVHNAFLHGDLEEEVYMKLPPGFRSQASGKVCRLRKSLYGLKQAPRCWFAKLAGALKRYGFAQSSSDHSLFTLQRERVQLHVLVYVDDLVISGNDNVVIKAFKLYLNVCFHMKDLGMLKYFLGIEVAHPERYRRLVGRLIYLSVTRPELSYCLGV